nr:uncharacterized protein LOC127490791 [Oryctolagus cuniculus]
MPSPSPTPRRPGPRPGRGGGAAGGRRTGRRGAAAAAAVLGRLLGFASPGRGRVARQGGGRRSPGTQRPPAPAPPAHAEPPAWARPPPPRCRHPCSACPAHASPGASEGWRGDCGKPRELDQWRAGERIPDFSPVSGADARRQDRVGARCSRSLSRSLQLFQRETPAHSPLAKGQPGSRRGHRLGRGLLRCPGSRRNTPARCWPRQRLAVPESPPPPPSHCALTLSEAGRRSEQETGAGTRTVNKTGQVPTRRKLRWGDRHGDHTRALPVKTTLNFMCRCLWNLGPPD